MNDQISVKDTSAMDSASTSQMQQPKLCAGIVQRIQSLIDTQRYDDVVKDYSFTPDSEKYITGITPEVAMGLYEKIVQTHLNEKTRKNNEQLYICAETVFKVVAVYASPEELLLEVLELLQSNESDYVFTIALHALQALNRRIGDHRPGALDWSLSTVQTVVLRLPLPQFLSNGYGDEERRLLEQHEQIHRLLVHLITIGHFYEPILNDIILKNRAAGKYTHEVGLTRRNVLCCFLLQLLGRPFALLDLSKTDKHLTNSDTMRVAKQLTESVTKCVGDPFYFLGLVEDRMRWQQKPQKSVEDCIEEQTSSNIFMLESKLSMHGLAIYFYLLLVQDIGSDAVPKLYAPLFVFETMLYLVTELMTQTEPPLHLYGLLLIKHVLDKILTHTRIPCTSIELNVHRNFCQALTNIVIYEEEVGSRRLSLTVLHRYVMQFDNEGRYRTLKYLLHSITHSGVLGYLACMYKDLVSEALFNSNSEKSALPSTFCGAEFRHILMNNIFHLPFGASTDLISHVDKIVPALNALRLFALKDCDNLTGFWNFYKEIEQNFMEPLRQALDFSVSHYQHELQRTEQGLDLEQDVLDRASLSMLEVSIKNQPFGSSPLDVEITRQRKIEVFQQSLCTFELIRSLWCRAYECANCSYDIYKSKSLKDDQMNNEHQTSEIAEEIKEK